MVWDIPLSHSCITYLGRGLSFLHHKKYLRPDIYCVLYYKLQDLGLLGDLLTTMAKHLSQHLLAAVPNGWPSPAAPMSAYVTHGTGNMVQRDVTSAVDHRGTTIAQKSDDGLFCHNRRRKYFARHSLDGNAGGIRCASQFPWEHKCGLVFATSGRGCAPGLVAPHWLALHHGPVPALVYYSDVYSYRSGHTPPDMISNPTAWSRCTEK